MTRFLLGRGHTAAEYSNFVRRLLAHLDEGSGEEDEEDLLHGIVAQTCQKHIAKRYTDSRNKDTFLGITTVAAFGIERSELAQAALDAVDDSFDASIFQNLGR